MHCMTAHFEIHFMVSVCQKNCDIICVMQYITIEPCTDHQYRVTKIKKMACNIMAIFARYKILKTERDTCIFEDGEYEISYHSSCFSWQLNCEYAPKIIAPIIPRAPKKTVTTYRRFRICHPVGSLDTRKS